MINYNTGLTLDIALTILKTMKKKKVSKAKPVLGTKQERFEMILEDMHTDIKLIAEQSAEHSKRFDSMDKRFDKIDKRLDLIEVRLAAVEIRLDEHSDNFAALSKDLDAIRQKLANVVTRDEFIALEKRLSLLENKVRANL